MIIFKTPEEIAIIKEGGAILAKIIRQVSGSVKPGITLRELNDLAESLILDCGGRPSFKDYDSGYGEPPFPSALCASVNSEIVHAPGNRDLELKNGDIIGLDLGMEYKGLYTDMAVTAGVGRVSKEARKLMKVTKRSLELAIKQVRPGNYVHDISRAIQYHVESQGFSVVRDLVGHGVGKAVHEDPRIPNFIEPGQKRVELKEGMVIAIEPMVNAGTYRVRTQDDGWTVSTFDGKLSAHFEHTVAVTKNGHEIMTI